MTGALITLAVLFALGGLLELTGATAGVGILALACLLAIFARIAQASGQHRELMGRPRVEEPKGLAIAQP
jgi:hypothetical protein